MKILKAVLLITGSLLFISSCGSSTGGNTPSKPSDSQPPQITFHAYVDAANGDDANPGTEDEPFKSITHALTAAGPDKNIKVLPGTYSAGETFPIALLEGQAIIGDMVYKGEGEGGTYPTLIIGSGTVSGETYTATITGADNSRVSGFKISVDNYIDLHRAIDVNNEKMEISYNTFMSPVHGGVHFKGEGASIVKFNRFDTDNYGVYSADPCTSCPTIRGNRFVAMDTPIHIHTDAVIRDNTIIGSGYVGIETSGKPLIEGNTFSNETGYTFGAIYLYENTSIPMIRGNTFKCTTAIIVSIGQPDLGTADDPGNNDFSQVTGISLTHSGTALITAIGNTWPNSPPELDTDIKLNGSGSVKWGINDEDIYPLQP